MAKKRIAWMAAAVMVCFGSSALAETHTVGHVCDVKFVAEKADSPAWVILDARSRAEYEAGHIPGAVHFGEPAHKVLRNPVDGRRLTDEKTARLLGQIGLDNRKGLIVYGKQGDYRAAVEMIPVYLGAKAFFYLDGGFDAWAREGKPVQTDPVKPEPAVFKPKVTNRRLYASTYEMIRISKEKPKNVTVIDNRTYEEYEGIENTTIRGGRFPGAILISFDRNLDPATGKMLPDDALRELYKDVPVSHTVILYGHKSARTAFSFFALERLGYRNVRIYEDGWIVYGVRSDTKIENEAYQDRRGLVLQSREFPDLKERIRILEEKMKELEARK